MLDAATPALRVMCTNAMPHDDDEVGTDLTGKNPGSPSRRRVERWRHMTRKQSNLSRDVETKRLKLNGRPHLDTRLPSAPSRRGTHRCVRS